MLYQFYKRKIDKQTYRSRQGEVNNYIGTYIKHERNKQGLKQDYVCDGLCSRSYYSRIENNIVKPTALYLKHIFKKLNKNIADELSTIHLNQEKRFITFIDAYVTRDGLRMKALIDQSVKD